MKAPLLPQTLKALTLASLIAGIPACGGQSDNASATLDQYVDSRGHDVSMLQSWLGDTVALDISDHLFADRGVNPDLCETVSSDAPRQVDGKTLVRKTVDCTRQVEAAAKLDGFDQVSPLITDRALYTYDQVVGTSKGYTQTGSCELVEFRTVTRDAALQAASFHGIGLHLSTSTFGGGTTRFVEKSRLHAVGNVTLKDGAPATVHRFVALGMCFGLGGNGGSIAYRQYVFRPFAQYKVQENGEHDFYSVWDDVATDYLLGRSSTNTNIFTESFDRQSELLKP